jgi:hypothetical protein
MKEKLLFFFWITWLLLLEDGYMSSALQWKREQMQQPNLSDGDTQATCKHLRVDTTVLRI